LSAPIGSLIFPLLFLFILFSFLEIFICDHGLVHAFLISFLRVFLYIVIDVILLFGHSFSLALFRNIWVLLRISSLAYAAYVKIGCGWALQRWISTFLQIRRVFFINLRLTEFFLQEFLLLMLTKLFTNKASLLLAKNLSFKRSSPSRSPS
jgi:hypothetical protein